MTVNNNSANVPIMPMPNELLVKTYDIPSVGKACNNPNTVRIMKLFLNAFSALKKTYLILIFGLSHLK